MVQAASSPIPASRCKSAPVTWGLRLAMLAARPGMLAVCLGMLAARPGMLAVHPGMLAGRLLAIQSPPACSNSGHTIRKPEPIWATMTNAIPVREPRW